MKRAGAVLSVIFCGVLGSGVAQAGFVATGSAVSLADLLASCTGLNCVSSITAGDKTFTGFFFTVQGTPTGTVVDDVNGLTVTPGTYTGATGGPMLGFELGGQISDTAGETGPAAALDIHFGYVVTASGGPLIEDVGSAFNGACQPTSAGKTGQCSVSVNEQASGTSADGVWNNQVLATVNIKNPPPNGNLYEDVGLANPNSPFQSVTVPALSIFKDISLSAQPLGAGNGSDEAVISSLDQFFSQTPEPSSYAFILGVGMLALFYSLRRRSNVS